MLTVFYGEQVYATYNSMKEMWEEVTVDNPVYQEGVCHIRYAHSSNEWFNCDGSPLLIEDVPPVLRMMVLLLE